MEPRQAEQQLPEASHQQQSVDNDSHKLFPEFHHFFVQISELPEHAMSSIFNSKSQTGVYSIFKKY